MRSATFVVVLAIHALIFLLFAATRAPLRRMAGHEREAPATLVFLREIEQAPKATPTARTSAHRTTSKPPDAAVNSARQPQSTAITPTPAPDWRAEAQIAAIDAIDADERRRRTRSVLAPHDFSGVKPGSTDERKPKFAWSHAATHRVEELPGGGLKVNINDQCSVTVVFIFPFPLCQVGKLPVHGNLFDRMKDDQTRTHP